VFVNIKMRWPF